jgi:flagellar biosynthesis/type III secretory pathway chaperone
VSTAALGRILDLLAEEERLLGELITLAREKQQALIASEYPRIEAVSHRMLETVRQVETREAERMKLLGTLAGPCETLDDLVALAEDHGVTGFEVARDRLLERARELREAQEANARLVLGAIRLRDRWAAILSGHLAPTYGPAGQTTLQEGSGFVSRSA